MTTITDQKQLEQELKELYAVLYRQVGMSKNMFADQYYKFGIAELRRLRCCLRMIKKMGRPAKQFWTVFDVERLKNNWRTLNDEDLMSLLKRDMPSIARKGKYLGLRGRLCGGRRSVAETHPKVLKIWDSENDKTPNEMTAGSNYLAKWKCPVALDHCWSASIATITNSNQDIPCPCCDGKLVVLSNCLLTTSPGVAAAWCYEKNGDNTPSNVIGGSYWLQCDNGHTAYVELYYHKLQGRYSCRECEFSRINANHKSWKGHGEISGQYWGSLKHGAEIRSIQFDIKIHTAWDLFLQQQGRCALTGEKLIMLAPKDTKRTASLDRIDSSLHYQEGNLQWIHKHWQGLSDKGKEHLKKLRNG